MKWCSWRRVNKVKTFFLIPSAFTYVLLSGNLGSIKYLAILSWVTWLDASIGSWRADED